MNSLLIQDWASFLRPDIIFKTSFQGTQTQDIVYEKNRSIVSIIYHILLLSICYKVITGERNLYTWLNYTNL